MITTITSFIYLGGPEISYIGSSTESSMVAVGSAIELWCIVLDENITVNLIWHDPRGNIIPLTSVNETAASTIIMAMGSEDFGNYNCVADNGFGIDNRTITISQGGENTTHHQMQ